MDHIYLKTFFSFCFIFKLMMLDRMQELQKWQYIWPEDGQLAGSIDVTNCCLALTVTTLFVITFKLFFCWVWIHSFAPEKKKSTRTFHHLIESRCPGSLHLALMWPVSSNKSKWEFLSSSQAIETAGSFYCLRKQALHIDSALPEISPDAFRFPRAFCGASQSLSFVICLIHAHSS